MRLPKQVINLAGTIVVLAAIAVGVVSVAMPLYLQSMATGAQVAAISGENETSAQQVSALKVAGAKLGDTQAAVAALTAGIPASPRLDDAFELIAAAAERSGVTVRSAAADDPAAWAPRGQPGADDATTTASGSEAAQDSGSDAGADAGADARTDAAAPAGGSSGTAAGPDLQIPLTITADAPTPEAAAAFIDALGHGPRLIGIVHASLSPQGEIGQLTVNALAFVHTEN